MRGLWKRNRGEDAVAPVFESRPEPPDVSQFVIAPKQVRGPRSWVADPPGRPTGWSDPPTTTGPAPATRPVRRFTPPDEPPTFGGFDHLNSPAGAAPPRPARDRPAPDRPDTARSPLASHPSGAHPTPLVDSIMARQAPPAPAHPSTAQGGAPADAHTMPTLPRADPGGSPVNPPAMPAASTPERCDTDRRVTKRFDPERSEPDASAEPARSRHAVPTAGRATHPDRRAETSPPSEPLPSRRMRATESAAASSEGPRVAPARTSTQAATAFLPVRPEGTAELDEPLATVLVHPSSNALIAAEARNRASAVPAQPVIPDASVVPHALDPGPPLIKRAAAEDHELPIATVAQPILPDTEVDPVALGMIPTAPQPVLEYSPPRRGSWRPEDAEVSAPETSPEVAPVGPRAPVAANAAEPMTEPEAIVEPEAMERPPAERQPGPFSSERDPATAEDEAPARVGQEASPSTGHEAERLDLPLFDSSPEHRLRAAPDLPWASTTRSAPARRTPDASPAPASPGELVTDLGRGEDARPVDGGEATAAMPVVIPPAPAEPPVDTAAPLLGSAEPVVDTAASPIPAEPAASTAAPLRPSAPVEAPGARPSLAALPLPLPEVPARPASSESTPTVSTPAGGPSAMPSPPIQPPVDRPSPVPVLPVSSPPRAVPITPEGWESPREPSAALASSGTPYPRRRDIHGQGRSRH